MPPATTLRIKAAARARSVHVAGPGEHSRGSVSTSSTRRPVDSSTRRRRRGPNYGLASTGRQDRHGPRCRTGNTTRGGAIRSRPHEAQRPASQNAGLWCLHRTSTITYILTHWTSLVAQGRAPCRLAGCSLTGRSQQARLDSHTSHASPAPHGRSATLQLHGPA